MPRNLTPKEKEVAEQVMQRKGCGPEGLPQQMRENYLFEQEQVLTRARESFGLFFADDLKESLATIFQNEGVSAEK